VNGSFRELAEAGLVDDLQRKAAMRCVSEAQDDSGASNRWSLTMSRRPHDPAHFVAEPVAHEADRAPSDCPSGCGRLARRAKFRFTES